MAVILIIPARIVDAQTSGQPVGLDTLRAGCCTLRIRQQGMAARGVYAGTIDSGILLEDCRGPLCRNSGGKGVETITVDRQALVEIRMGNHATLGTMVGAGVGAALLAAIVAGGPSEDLTGESLVKGVLFLVIPGSLLGTAIGWRLPRWEPVSR
jgi:hypothetical protein